MLVGVARRMRPDEYHAIRGKMNSRRMAVDGVLGHAGGNGW